MRTEYSKPQATVVSFELADCVATTGPNAGLEWSVGGPPGGWDNKLPVEETTVFE